MQFSGTLGEGGGGGEEEEEERGVGVGERVGGEGGEEEEPWEEEGERF